MKHSILLFFLFVVTTHLSGQTVLYSYDESGNRTDRIIEMNSMRSQTEESTKQVTYSEMLNEVKVSIYPNPTEGLLKVELLNLDSKQIVNILLYDISGKLIIKKEHVSSFTEMNISNHAPGIYILKIISATFQSDWKIIKK